MNPPDQAAVRVLMASRVFEPEANAAAFRLGALARTLARRGASVTVLTAKPPRYRFAPARFPDGLRVTRWPVLRDGGGNVRGYLQYASFDAPLGPRMLFRHFDVVVSEAPPTTGLVAWLVTTVRRRPLVYYAADVWTDGVGAVGAPRLVVRLIRSLERWVLRRSAAILSVSDAVSSRLVQLGANPSRITVVGHGVDTDVFRPDGPFPSNAGSYFVYTGTMSEVHSPQVFLSAFALIADKYPDVRIAFFGQGVFELQLRELAARLLPGRVDFGGVIPAAETAVKIRGAIAAMVSLTPGIGYDFAHPTKAYAAAACGTPILFAGPDTFGDIVRGAHLGEAVEHDPRKVATAMVSLIEDSRSDRSEMGRTDRAGWARANVSLSAVGDRAATAVLAALPESHLDRR